MEDKKALVAVSQNRIIYLDVLRILATFAVISIHVCSQNWNKVSLDSYEWNVFNVYNSFSRWAVPIFVMISGTLFLDNKRKIDIKKLYTKNILRIITAFIFWSMFYAIIENDVFGKYRVNMRLFMRSFIVGHYHLWFLHMIIGLYILTPILRKITSDPKTTEYFLIISIFFTFIVPIFFRMPRLESSAKVLEYLNLDFKYITYFVLGYYLSVKELSRKKRNIIYFFSFLGFFATIFGSVVISNNRGAQYGLYSNLYINVLLEAVGLFIFVKNLKLNIDLEKSKMFKNLVQYSFGIYVLHVLIMDALQEFGLTTLTFNPIISIPIIIILIFSTSAIISAILNHIPIVKKYIV